MNGTALLRVLVLWLCVSTETVFLLRYKLRRKGMARERGRGARRGDVRGAQLMLAPRVARSTLKMVETSETIEKA
jgi:hypothetical protein